MNILIADDEEGFRSLLHDTLGTDPTIHVSAACDGLEAWWLLTDPEHRFDLAIFDIKMPRLSGINLLKRVRGTARFRSMPVILCSGNNDRETVLKSTELSASYYLVKPFKIEVLMEKVHHLANTRRAPAAIVRSHARATASPLLAGTPAASDAEVRSSVAS
jgi:two-component system, chemotaxis family, chemotaxis protein CheY